MGDTNLKALLDEQLNEILITEILILDILPAIEDKISDSKLLRAIRGFKRLTRHHSRHLQRILQRLDVKMETIRPEEFENLISEVISLTEYSCDPEVVDVNIASGLNRLNSFQSACYGAASIYAQTLGYEQVASTLQKLITEKQKNLTAVVLAAEDAVDRTRDN